MAASKPKPHAPKIPRPPDFLEAYLSPTPQMLNALGFVAVAAAGVEDVLHSLYWRLCGLTQAQGPIVTGNMRLDRLADDMARFAEASKMDRKQVEDLRDTFSDLKQLTTKRNQLLHGIWRKASHTAHKLASPGYRSKVEIITWTAEEVLNLAYDLEWMEARLESHCSTRERLLKRRKALGANKDVYAPAPWL
jgi:hypothetical protein